MSLDRSVENNESNKGSPLDDYISKTSEHGDLSLGECIRKVRKQKGLSLRELARRVDMSNSYLSQLENGHNSNPDTKIINKISDTLGLARIDLLLKVDSYREAFEGAIEESTEKKVDTIFENYEYIKGLKKESMYQEHTFSLDHLLGNNETKLTYEGIPINEDEKKKILTIIDTILK